VLHIITKTRTNPGVRGDRSAPSAIAARIPQSIPNHDAASHDLVPTIAVESLVMQL